MHPLVVLNLAGSSVNAHQKIVYSM